MITLLNGPVYLPPHVREALNTPMCDLRNPRFIQAYDESRKAIATLLGAEGYGTVLASGSGTFGVELVLRSLLGPRDCVLALILGTFSERMAEMAELTGAVVHRQGAAAGDVVSIDDIENVFAKIKPHYLLTAHVEPSTATQIDLKAVAEACYRHHVIPIVDGVCAGFALDVHCRDSAIGAYITASQKGLALPPGMAVAVVSPPLIERAKAVPRHRTGLYGHLLSWLGEKPAFTPPLLHVFALAKSLEHISHETMPLRAARHRRMADRVRAWGRRHSLRSVPLRDDVSADTLSAFYYPQGLDDLWLRRLRDEAGLELAPSNDPRLTGAYFRIGHLGDIPEEYLLQGLAILDEALDKQLIPVRGGVHDFRK